jgi:hypothetical protein
MALVKKIIKYRSNILILEILKAYVGESVIDVTVSLR